MRKTVFSELSCLDIAVQVRQISSSPTDWNPGGVFLRKWIYWSLSLKSGWKENTGQGNWVREKACCGVVWNRRAVSVRETAETPEISILSVCECSVLMAFIPVRNGYAWCVCEGSVCRWAVPRRQPLNCCCFKNNNKNKQTKSPQTYLTSDCTFLPNKPLLWKIYFCSF